MNVPPSYVHWRVAVWMTLPCTFTAEWQCNLHCHSGLSVQYRVDGTATRPSAYRFGTLDAIWQCETHCHSGLSVQSRVSGTATRA